MNIDFSKISFQDYTNTLPDSYRLRSLNFLPIYGESLYEKVLKEDD